MTSGEKIAYLRREKGVSAATLGTALGVSEAAVLMWERGEVEPGTENLKNAGKYFGVSTARLMDDDRPTFEDTGSDSLAHADTPAAEGAACDGPACEVPADTDVPVSDEAPYVPAETTAEEKAEGASAAKKILCAFLCVCVLLAAVMVPMFTTNTGKNFWWKLNGGKVNYPVVLVHGLGGYGDNSPMNVGVSYWGGTSGSIKSYLQAKGYKVYVPTVGAYSSTWDRACELYAQLTGTTVDYGEAHSAAHNHDRYGTEYTKPMISGWGEKSNGGQMMKINLIGHSFGGETVRMLTWLLENGSEAEKKASGDDVSPLFEGGKGDYVFSVTTLCSPHNGSQLSEVANSAGKIFGIKDSTNLTVSVISNLLNFTGGKSGIFSGIADIIGFSFGSSKEIQDTISRIAASGDDNAIYELSPDGAAELNKKMGMVKDVYYFSYSYSTLEDGKPLANTLPVLSPLAVLMRDYTGTTDGGIKIDESWSDNDGLVSVASAKFPKGEKHADIPDDLTECETGIWYVMPVRQGDHGTPIGLNESAKDTRAFYDEITTMLNTVKR